MCILTCYCENKNTKTEMQPVVKSSDKWTEEEADHVTLIMLGEIKTKNGYHQVSERAREKTKQKQFEYPALPSRWR